MSFSVFFFPKHNKLDKHNTVPIYCRISTSTKDRVEYYTKIRIDPKLWLKQPKRASNGMTQYIKGSIEKIKNYNITLNLIESKVQKKYNELLDAEIDITASELKALLNDDNTEKITLIDMMTKLQSRRNTEDSKKTIGYYTNALQQFLKETYDVVDIPTKAMTQKRYAGFGAKFVDWGMEKGWSKLYTKSILSTVKSAMNLAVGFHHNITYNPIIYNFTVKTHEVKQKDTLSFEEVEKLEKTIFKKKHLSYTKDVFLFQIYTGLSYTDVKHLAMEHFTKGIDGRTWIIKKREKTKRVAKIPLIKKAQDLLDKYTNLPDKLLPIVHRSAYNRNLKTLAKLLNINKNLSSHCGRHTFATLMRESGSDLSNVKQIVAHSDTSMTEHYAHLTPGTLIDEMNKLEQKLGT